MNTRITVGQTSMYVVSYLNRASGLLHDSVLTILSNAFLTSLSELNLLSSNARVSKVRKEQLRGEWTIRGNISLMSLILRGKTLAILR